jgi:hypothetical protein
MKVGNGCFVRQATDEDLRITSSLALLVMTK